MRFPFTNRDFDELRLISEEYLPIYDDSEHFFSESFSEIRAYSRYKDSEKEYLLYEFIYDRNGIITSRRFWDRTGKLWKEEQSEIIGNKLIIHADTDRTIWTFNSFGNLKNAIYGAGKEYEEQMVFKYDEEQNVIGIDETIKIEWKGGHPFIAKNIDKNIILTHIAERTKTKSRIFYPSVRNQRYIEIPRIINYSENGELISDEQGTWLKKVEYFRNDSRKGKRIIQYLNGKQNSVYSEEETLIDNGVIEVKLTYQGKENSPKEYYRILKKIKTTANTH